MLRNIKNQIIQIRYSLFPEIHKHLYCGYPLKIYINDLVSKQWYDTDWKRNEIEFLKRGKLKRGATVFNIGAHQGIVALIFSKIVGQNGYVIAAEPDKHHIRILNFNKKNNNASNLHIVHAAVAEKRGSKFFVNDQITDHKTKLGTRIRTITVDDLTKKYGSPSLLFIDVEGYEVNVLKGAKQTLKYYPNCCVEVHTNCGLEEYGGSIEKVLSYFPTNKYKLFIAPATSRCRFTLFSNASQLLNDRFYLVAIAK